MTRIVLVLVTVSLLGCVPPSGPSQPTATAVEMAAVIVANAEAPLLGAYRHEGLAAVANVRLTGDKEADKAVLDAIQVDADRRWQPALTALSLLRQAEMEYNRALDKGYTPDQEAVEALLCRLFAAIPAPSRLDVLGGVTVLVRCP